MQYPKFSIITPSYNQGKFIEETILSVINQDYNNFEYFIIDGGSNDNTIDIIKKYDNRIDYWISEPDKGTWHANNKGLECISGDYWCILNSDDYFLPNTLKIIANIINEDGAKWITGGSTLINEKGKLVSEFKAIKPKPTAGFSFITKNWAFHPSTFLHKSIIYDIGSFRNIDIMDYDYWLRLELNGYKPYVVNEQLSAFRFHDNCKTMDFLKMYKLNINLLSELYKNNRNKFLSANRVELIEKINFWKHYYYKAKFQWAVYKKSVFKIFIGIFSLLFFFPKDIFTRWFWGSLKRVFSGMKIEEVHPHHYINTIIDN